jgi:hypothetical protein
MSQAKVTKVYRQVFVIAGGLILTGVVLSQTIHDNWIWLSGVIATAMTFFGVIGFCPMLWLLRQLPWNKDA